MPSLRADARAVIIGALILNGAWGLGVALFIRLLARIGV
jgi:hypothetical protein